MNDFYTKLGKAVADEASFNGVTIDESCEIEHQLGTVWVTDPKTNKTISISPTATEE